VTAKESRAARLKLRVKKLKLENGSEISVVNRPNKPTLDSFVGQVSQAHLNKPEDIEGFFWVTLAPDMTVNWGCHLPSLPDNAIPGFVQSVAQKIISK